MAESQTTDDELTFETPDGATMLDSERKHIEDDDGANSDGVVTVPETFDSETSSVYLRGSVPDEWDTQMVFKRNGVINACALIEDDARARRTEGAQIWVNAMYHTEETRPHPETDWTGWIVYTKKVSRKTLDDVEGETLWRVDED